MQYAPSSSAELGSKHVLLGKAADFAASAGTFETLAAVSPRETKIRKQRERHIFLMNTINDIQRATIKN